MLYWCTSQEIVNHFLLGLHKLLHDLSRVGISIIFKQNTISKSRKYFRIMILVALFLKLETTYFHLSMTLEKMNECIQTSNFETPCLYVNSILVNCLLLSSLRKGVEFCKFYDTSSSYYFKLSHIMSVSNKLASNCRIT